MHDMGGWQTERAKERAASSTSVGISHAPPIRVDISRRFNIAGLIQRGIGHLVDTRRRFNVAVFARVRDAL